VVKGVFLKNIVKRYIKIARQKNFLQEKIKEDLETYIHGIEIDYVAYKKCIKNLNWIFKANYDIKYGDAFLINNYEKKMDFVVGNLPYVKIHNFNQQHQDIVYQKKLKGMVNLYLLFYLLSFQQLNSTGKLIYITPSFLKNYSSKFLREKIYHEKNLVHLYNFKHQQIFPNITTYSIVSLFDKSQKNQKLNYSVVELKNNSKEKINFVSTIELEWKQLIIENMFIFEQQILSENKKIFAKENKIYCEVKNSFATLSDNIFISNKFPFCSSDIIKVKKCSTGEEKECIFPYRYDKEKKKCLLKKFDELDKNTQIYLLNFQSQLKNRSIKEKDKWWQFGRTQAINNVWKEKIYLNSLFNKNFDNINLGIVPPGMGIYGGTYILPHEINLQNIEKHLKNENFKNFVKTFGEHKNGNYYLINSRILTKYLNYCISFSDKKILQKTK